VPVLGITGTGGAGKSSLTDELVRGSAATEDKLRIAVLAIDPSRRRGGGALLGDRIRMNTIAPGRVFFRSMATRHAGGEVPDHLDDVIAACKAAGFDLVIVETPGIGQGDAAHRPVRRRVAVRDDPGVRGRVSAREDRHARLRRRGRGQQVRTARCRGRPRDVARQLVRNREAFGTSWEDMPVFGTSAARFDDDGVTALYQELAPSSPRTAWPRRRGAAAGRDQGLHGLSSVIPPGRERYLPRSPRRSATTTAPPPGRPSWCGFVSTCGRPGTSSKAIPTRSRCRRSTGGWRRSRRTSTGGSRAARVVARHGRGLLGEEFTYTVRDREFRVPLTRETLAGTKVRRVALPRLHDDGDLLTVPAQREPAGPVPLHRRGVPVQA
jgi:isobutyryl-CoA mutase